MFYGYRRPASRAVCAGYGFAKTSPASKYFLFHGIIYAKSLTFVILCEFAFYFAKLAYLIK